MDMKAKELLKHSVRTAIIASSFSKFLKCQKMRLITCLLVFYYDIGKLFIPNNILYKESKLTEKNLRNKKTSCLFL